MNKFFFKKKVFFFFFWLNFHDLHELTSHEIYDLNKNQNMRHLDYNSYLISMPRIILLRAPIEVDEPLIFVDFSWINS
jgi:hypothetical protein